jgi:hypothetical protein
MDTRNLNEHVILTCLQLQKVFKTNTYIDGKI